MKLDLPPGTESFDGKRVWLLGTWVPKDLAIKLADAYVAAAADYQPSPDSEPRG